MEEKNFYSVNKPTFTERFLNWLFPQTYLEPAEEAPGYVPGELATDTYITFCIKDRLRVLVSGKAVLRARTQTDVIVNTARTRSTFSALHPWAR